MNPRRSLIVMTTCFTLALGARSAAAGPLVAIGEDVAFTAPQVSADGMLAVLRRENWTGAPATATMEILSLDLTACPKDVLRELSHFGHDATEATLSSDGRIVVLLVATNPGFEFWGSMPQGHPPSPLFATTDGQDQSLDVSDDGRFLTYVATNNGNTAVFRADLLAAPPITPQQLDSAPTLQLSQEHPIAHDGTVFYTKVVTPGSHRHIFKCGLTGGPTQITSGISDEGSYSVTQVGATQTLAYFSTLGTTASLVVASSPSWAPTSLAGVWPPDQGEDLDISRDGSRIAFVNRYNPVGENADLSLEVFRINTDGTGVLQVTHFVDSSFDPTTHIPSVTASSDASVILYSVGSCELQDCPNAAKRNSFKVHYESPDRTVTCTSCSSSSCSSCPSCPTPVGDADQNLIVPPFDIVTGEDPSNPPVCTANGSSVSCAAFVRNSPEGDRNLLIIQEWNLPAQGACAAQVIRRAPISVPLCAGQNVTVTDTYTFACGVSAPPPTGTFTIRAVSLDVDQADSISLSASFP